MAGAIALLGTAGSVAATVFVLAGGPAGTAARGQPGARPTGLLDDLAARIAELPPVRHAREAAELQQRRATCLSQLPVLLDVVTLGLHAGLSFDSALELYCERYRGTELGRAFDEALLSWRIGSKTREAALMALADELDVAALRRFASVVCESLAFGTPLSETLEQQAQVIRDEQRSQVEEEIEKVPVKMLVPLGTLIVPAMFLAILGPLLGSALTLG